MLLWRRSPLISVVIANYNNERYLGPCIDSLLMQTHRNLEILFVDDHSTDNSLDFIRQIDDPRIRLIALDVNLGVSRARNTGIRSATGRYLTTLDSDDVFLDRRKLERELAVIKAREPDSDAVVFSNIVKLKESGERDWVHAVDDIREGQIFSGLLQREIFIPRDFLCKRSIYEEAGLYDPEIHMYEDWDLKLRIARRCGFYYSGLEGVGYRNRPGGLSKAKPECHTYWKNIVYNKNKPEE